MFKIAVDNIEQYEAGKLSVSLMVDAHTANGKDILRVTKHAYETNTGKDLSFQTDKRKVKGVIIDYKVTPYAGRSGEDTSLIELVLAMVEVTEASKNATLSMPLTIKEQREKYDNTFENHINDMLAEPIEEKPIYHRVAEGIADLVERDNIIHSKSVPNSVKILKVLYPNCIQTHQYKDAILIINFLKTIEDN